MLSNFGLEVGVDARAGFGNSAEPDRSLDGDQCADLALGEIHRGLNQLLDLLAHLAGKSTEQPRFAQPHDRPAQAPAETR